MSTSRSLPLAKQQSLAAFNVFLSMHASSQLSTPTSHVSPVNIERSIDESIKINAILDAVINIETFGLWIVVECFSIVFWRPYLILSYHILSIPARARLGELKEASRSGMSNLDSIKIDFNLVIKKQLN